MPDPAPPSAGRLLLVVDQTFSITGRLVVAPDLPEDAPPRGPLSVVLVRPDGSEQLVDAFIEHPLYNPPPPGRAIVLLLHGVGKEAVPVGTRVHQVSLTGPGAALPGHRLH